MADPHDQRITYFGETDFRNKKTNFGIKAKDRTRHMYVIGKTGVGKSTLMSNMIIQDIQNGEGVGVIDPHGELAESILNFVPEDRVKDVIYFAPFDTEYPISFNVLEDIGEDKRHLVVSGLMSVFKKIWQDAWSARMEYILNNTLLALLEYPGSTLMGVNKMLSDKEFRKKIVDNVKDPAVKSFWVDEYAKYTEKFAAEATPAIQNKIGQYTLNPLIRNIIGQPVSSFDIREIMDKKKIFIINLSKGRIGEQNMNLLGGMFVTKIYLAAMSRAEVTPEVMDSLPPFYFYVDEFQNFANESFAQILSEARKYKLALTVANQYVTQMVDEVRDAILGNVGSMVTFRIGPTDAEVFEKEFTPTFVAQDLTNLGFAQIYLRLMIDGMTSKPFSATTMAPIPKPDIIYRNQIIDSSRLLYAKPKAQVEEEIKSWHEESHAKPKEPYVPRTSVDVPVSSYAAKETMRKPFADKLPSSIPSPQASTIHTPTTPSSYPRPDVVIPLVTEKKPSTHDIPRPVHVIEPAPAKPLHSAPKAAHVPSSQPTIRPPHVIKREPATPSPKLKDLLSQLQKTEVYKKETPVPKSVPVVSEVKKVEPSVKSPVVEIKLEEKIIEKPPSISLSALHGSKKDPSPEKKAELKALLMKVMKKEELVTEIKKEPAKIAETKTSPTPVVSEEKIQSPSTKQSSTSEPAPHYKKQKEVPEDVLHTILHS